MEIRAAHKRTRETYGPERLQKDMSAHGVNLGICRIRRIRKKLGICCKQKRKFKATTNSKHKLPVAENLLEQKFEATAPNKVWVTDNPSARDIQNLLLFMDDYPETVRGVLVHNGNNIKWLHSKVIAVPWWWVDC